MKFLSLKVLFFFFFGIFHIGVIAQNDAAYLLLDKKIGLDNSMLSNGIESLDREITINTKNKYFVTSQDFNISSITYEDYYYPNVRLKFNVHDDLVLVQIPVQNKYSTFQLITPRIQKFNLLGHKFENIGTQTNNNYPGFYENLFEGSSIKLLKKYRKSFKRKMDRDYTYYEFEPTDAEYIFEYHDEFYPANNKREILSVFSDQKSEIKTFYREQRSVLRNQPEQFMVQLFKDISHQLEKSE